MTVQELINKLSKFPPDYRIMKYDSEWDSREDLAEPEIEYLSKKRLVPYKKPGKWRFGVAVIY